MMRLRQIYEPTYPGLVQLDHAITSHGHGGTVSSLVNSIPAPKSGH